MFSPQMLMNIPQYYENRFGRRRLLEKVQELVDIDRPEASLMHDLIAELPCQIYYTTNYDEILETSLRQMSRRFSLVVSDDAARVFIDRRGCQLRKIHGTLSQPSTLVVTRSDYAQFVHQNSLTLDALRTDLAQYHFLFIGYSLSDPDFSSIYDNVLYFMGRMRQTHYMCIPTMTPLEEEDLRQRGIEAVDLSRWPGKTITDQLQSFLQALVDATSTVVHARRFFVGLDRDHETPTIITSRLHEIEQYAYFPASDLYTARQVERSLEAIGYRSSIVADHEALISFDSYKQQNLVLICSPFGNAFSAQLFEELGKLTTNIDIRWTQEAGQRHIVDERSGRTFTPDIPTTADGERLLHEYAVIARYRNPWAVGKWIFMFMGVNAIGTHAVGHFLSDQLRYRDLAWDTDDLAVVLHITYRTHNPYRYLYDVAEIIPLTQ